MLVNEFSMKLKGLLSSLQPPYFDGVGDVVDAVKTGLSLVKLLTASAPAPPSDLGETFWGFLMVAYNETRLNVQFTREQGSLDYLFNANSTGKLSYNGILGNLTVTQCAQLLGVKLSATTALEGSGRYFTPALQALPVTFLANCDFNVYRGTGYIQSTGRTTIRNAISIASKLAPELANLPVMVPNDQMTQICATPVLKAALIYGHLQLAGQLGNAMKNNFSSVPTATHGGVIQFKKVWTNYAQLARTRFDLVRASPAFADLRLGLYSLLGSDVPTPEPSVPTVVASTPVEKPQGSDWTFGPMQFDLFV